MTEPPYVLTTDHERVRFLQLLVDEVWRTLADVPADADPEIRARVAGVAYMTRVVEAAVNGENLTTVGDLLAEGSITA